MEVGVGLGKQFLKVCFEVVGYKLSEMCKNCIPNTSYYISIKCIYIRQYHVIVKRCNKERKRLPRNIND